MQGGSKGLLGIGGNGKWIYVASVTDSGRFYGRLGRAWFAFQDLSHSGAPSDVGKQCPESRATACLLTRERHIEPMVSFNSLSV